ncbi:hypothetical protein LOK49_LG05G02637 [Camellia lanceoleosa]|uniref:Uncharacterized protein n=1 Tax=Camellia lanceoleosa TaxID=1840588 RepID=A0ACC0HRD4_9ERIC|nr:hypothetical protein LOK49_LG05G02637 [Camellia lanceoleosa]
MVNGDQVNEVHRDNKKLKRLALLAGDTTDESAISVRVFDVILRCFAMMAECLFGIHSSSIIDTSVVWQSLCGHASPVESVTFDLTEVLVLVRACAGVIKLWDLEEKKRLGL